MTMLLLAALLQSPILDVFMREGRGCVVNGTRTFVYLPTIDVNTGDTIATDPNKADIRISEDYGPFYPLKEETVTAVRIHYTGGTYMRTHYALRVPIRVGSDTRHIYIATRADGIIANGIIVIPARTKEDCPVQ